MKRACLASLCVATGLLAVAAQTASAALPRAGYWSARIGKTGPSVAMLVSDSRREIVTMLGRMDVQCPDGHTHTINIGSPGVPIAADGTFVAAHSGPPQELDHPGIDGWSFGGVFSNATHGNGSVALTWTGEGEACHAPADRRTWTARWRAHPSLAVVPGTVRRGSMLTIRGKGYVPSHHVHVELPNRVRTLGTVVVLQQSLRVFANRHGRFTVRVRVPRKMKVGTQFRAQAWQYECTTVCWVQAEDFYRVTE